MWVEHDYYGMKFIFQLLTTHSDSPLDFPARGCPIRRASDVIGALFITIFLVELSKWLTFFWTAHSIAVSVIVILTAIKALSHGKPQAPALTFNRSMFIATVRQSRSSWVKQLYRDGIGKPLIFLIRCWRYDLGLFFCICMLCSSSIITRPSIIILSPL